MAIETVLLAVGPGDAERADALASAVGDVAAPTGAEVVLLHVFTEEEYDDVLEKLDFGDVGTSEASDVARRRTVVRDLDAALDERGIDVTVRGAVGPHGDSIVDVAETTGADMLFVGGGKRSPAGKAVFGSTAQEVLLNAPAPVTLVRGE